MNADFGALAAGTLLAVGALAFVLYPLFFDVRPRRRPAARETKSHADDSAIRALREIEFDKATGKLSDADYAELKREYGAKALRELRSAGAAAAVPTGSPTPPVVASPADPIEDRVRAYRASRRACRRCGLRPEPDAIFCSTCGAFLDGRCPECGADVPESSAGYCSHCGATLAATA